jgi:benzoate-CoA ligase
VNQVGNALAGLGVEIEQRVAILLPNCPEFVTSFFGAIKIGAVPTPMSYAVTPHEQAFLLADSRARAIVTTAGFWESLRTRRAEWPFLRQVLIVGGGALAPEERDFAAVVDAAPGTLAAAPTGDEDVAF